MPDRPRGQERQRPDERPAEDRGAARVLLCHVGRDDESDDERAERHEPDAPFRPAQPLANEPGAEREDEEREQGEADPR